MRQTEAQSEAQKHDPAHRLRVLVVYWPWSEKRGQWEENQVGGSRDRWCWVDWGVTGRKLIRGAECGMGCGMG